MSGRPRFRLLVFDAYGTLFDVYSVAALCEELAPGKGTALAQIWRAKQLQYSLLHTVMERHRDFWSLTADSLAYGLQALGLELPDKARQRLLDAYLTLTPFPDVRPALEALRRRGISLAILSNGAPGMLRAATGHAGINSLLDAVLSVEEVGIFKPSPRVYALPVDKFGVDRNAIGFVSSNSWDIAGARSAGLTTFWLQRAPTDLPEVLALPAHHTFGSLADLVDLC